MTPKVQECHELLGLPAIGAAMFLQCLGDSAEVRGLVAAVEQSEERHVAGPPADRKRAAADDRPAKRPAGLGAVEEALRRIAALDQGSGA